MTDRTLRALGQLILATEALMLVGFIFVLAIVLNAGDHVSSLSAWRMAGLWLFFYSALNMIGIGQTLAWGRLDQ